MKINYLRHVNKLHQKSLVRIAINQALKKCPLEKEKAGSTATLDSNIWPQKVQAGHVKRRPTAWWYFHGKYWCFNLNGSNTYPTIKLLYLSGCLRFSVPATASPTACCRAKNMELRKLSHTPKLLASARRMMCLLLACRAIRPVFFLQERL